MILRLLVYSFCQLWQNLRHYSFKYSLPPLKLSPELTDAFIISSSIVTYFSLCILFLILLSKISNIPLVLSSVFFISHVTGNYKMGPQKIFALIPRTASMMKSHIPNYVMLHGKRNFSNVIKVTSQLTLS